MPQKLSIIFLFVINPLRDAQGAARPNATAGLSPGGAAPFT
ncbi:hypothetical protein P3T22_004569 [Paraburkholderia sp. GAS348]